MKLKYILIAMVATAGSASAAISITNAGFEDGPIAGSEAFTTTTGSWRLGMDSGSINSGVQNSDPYSGLNSAYLNPEDGYIFQDIGVSEAGATYFASVYARQNYLNTAVTISLYEGGNLLVSSGSTADTTTYALYSTGTSAAAVGGQTLQIRIQNTGAAGSYLHIDEVSAFESVPEPSSTALLGLGGLALILRRRR